MSLTSVLEPRRDTREPAVEIVDGFHEPIARLEARESALKVARINAANSRS